ncbi:hypothetical protein BH24ACT5_BH24ACT5_03830 [soil metagenome]
MAAERGHEVTLAEAGPALGGAFRLAGLQPRRSQITELIEWYARQLDLLGVEVLLNHPLDGDEAAAFGADETIFATGSQPAGTGFQRFLPAQDAMPGADRPDACSIEDVLSHNARPAGSASRCVAPVPSRSKVPDGQAMAESTMSMMSAILCGTNFFLHSAGWLEGGLAMGYEKFVMDADFCGVLHRWLDGISLDPDAFALDGFREVGPGKHFFGPQHTCATTRPHSTMPRPPTTAASSNGATPVSHESRNELRG